MNINSKIILNVAGVVALSLGVVFLIFGIKKVSTGERAVLTHFGKVHGVLGEGLHLIVPFRDNLHHLSVRVQKITDSTSAQSKDLQNVTTQVALNCYLRPDKVNEVFQKLGVDYVSNIITPTIQESIKSATAKFNAEELITKRQIVKNQVREYITKRLSINNIIVTDFSIVDFDFSPKFVDAIEKKQIAEQNALRAKNDLERVKIEAQQKIEQAGAEAKAQALLHNTISKEIIELRMVEKWDGKMPQFYMGKDSGTMLDITKLLK